MGLRLQGMFNPSIDLQFESIVGGTVEGVA